MSAAYKHQKRYVDETGELIGVEDIYEDEQSSDGEAAGIMD